MSLLRGKEFEFDPVKNALLKESRGVSFEQVIDLIEGGNMIHIYPHPNRLQYPYQHIIEVLGENYVYRIPCILKPDGTIVLKTIYKSRQATRKYKKEKGA